MLALYRKIGDWGGEADALIGIAETQLAAAQPGQARSGFATALSLACRTGDRYQQARAHLGFSRANDATGHCEQAGRHRQQAVDICADLGIPDARRAASGE